MPPQAAAEAVNQHGQPCGHQLRPIHRGHLGKHRVVVSDVPPGGADEDEGRGEVCAMPLRGERSDGRKGRVPRGVVRQIGTPHKRISCSVQMDVHRAAAARVARRL
eukprot:1486212-Prymnesium_polylepis.2